MPASKNNSTLGVYIHWPFCASKCPYCDFNSHVADTVDQGRWRNALLAELAHFASETKGRAVTSVFFGGGTPSLMDPDTTAALIDAVKSHWRTDPDLEVTLEANPSTAEARRFRNFREAGVNRLSIGVQSFDDGALRFLGRGHSAKEAEDALRLAAETFPRFSFDLIYGLPEQSAEDWARELDRALALVGALAGDHLSLYQLSIESGTPFHRDGVQATGDDLGAALYGITQDRLDAAGLPVYEISNHARPGFECRHNLDIWRGGDYVGAGPGAHGRLTRCLAEAGGTETIYQIHGPERWLAAVEAGGHATAKRQPLTPAGRAEEILMTGLRLPGGIEGERFRALTGKDIDAFISPDGLKRMIDGKYIEADDAGLRATPAGRLCLNEVLRQLLAA
jgi:oxygen-independent coproporphyrinogen-3 oxidase